MKFFWFFSILYFGLFVLSFYIAIRSLKVENRFFKKEKNYIILILQFIPVAPSLYAIYILNTVFNNFVYAMEEYFDTSSFSSGFSSIPVVINIYKGIIETTIEYSLSNARFVCFILLVLSSFMYFKFSKKYTSSTKRMKGIERLLLNIVTSFLTLFIYPIYKGIKFLIDDSNTGTRRILKEGCEVIRDPKEAEKRLRIELAEVKNPGILFYKDVAIPYETESTNFLFMGGMGAGKTYAYMMRILRQFFVRGNRTIVSDVKGDFCEVFGGNEGVKILAPLDARSIAWDISVDVSSELEALEFVAYMIPLDNHGSAAAYFQQAARDIITGVIMYLQAEKTKQWSVVDIFKVVNDKAQLISALKNYRDGALEHIQDSGFDEAGNFMPSKQTTGILSDIRAHFQNLEILAKAWPNSCGGFSIKKYARGEDPSIKMLIIPFVSYYRTFSEFFSAMVLDFFFRSCFSLPDSFNERFGVFLDELGVLPRVPSFVEATKTLRTRGGSMFVCFQDCGVINSKYSKEGGTEEIFNGFATKCIGIARTAEYAEYFVRAFGENTYERILKSRQVDSRGRYSVNTVKDIVVEDAIVSGELLNLPKASRENPIATMFVQIEGIPIIFKLAMPIQGEEKKYKHSVMSEWVDAPPKKIGSSIIDLKSVLIEKEVEKSEKVIQNKTENLQEKSQESNQDIARDEVTEDKKVKKVKLKKQKTSENETSLETKNAEKISPEVPEVNSVTKTNEATDPQSDYMGPY